MLIDGLSRGAISPIIVTLPHLSLNTQSSFRLVTDLRHHFYINSMIWIYHFGVLFELHISISHDVYFLLAQMDIKWWDLWTRSKGSAIQEQYQLCIGPTDLRFGPMVHILFTAMLSARFKTCTKMKCRWTQIILNKYVMENINISGYPVH